MKIADLPQVLAIENQVFPTPWPAHAYEYEITRNPVCHCIVVEHEMGELVAYGCIWLIMDEVRVSTLAVAVPWRGRGLGGLLLSALIDEGIRRGRTTATLEVRASNRPAQALYAKFGFQVVGRRKRYYSDNQEDALIMSVEPLDATYQVRLAGVAQGLWVRLSTTQEGMPR